MVEWKGRLDSDAGIKAEKLDQVENFQVPNFFVITSEEISSIFEGTRSKDDILNTKINSGYREQIKDAYEDIGMSSEVRNANGRAKNLVGGQRNNQLVSVRVSSKGTGYEYELNIGSSDLMDAIKEVVASYYDEERSFPSIIIQKMVEPDYSGAAMTSTYDEPDLVEVVEGLGTSLEEGNNYPYLYIKDSEGVDTRVPPEHRKVSRNPINGEKKEKSVDPQLPFDESEVKEMLGKLDSEGINIKFVYKRGDFYVVDAWEEKTEYDVLKDSSIQGVKVAGGDINGVVGREILYTEETLPPRKYDNALVARQGGYTTRNAEKARKAGKPAVFGFTQQLSNGQKINMQSHDEEQSQQRGRRNKDTNGHRVTERRSSTVESSDSGSDNIDSVVGSETLPLNPREGEGVYTSPPFGDGYAVTDRDAGDEQIPQDSLVDSYGKAFSFEGEKLVLDARNLNEDGLEAAMEYIDAEFKILIVGRPDIEMLRKAVEADFDVFSTEGRYMEDLRSKLARAEKRFILDRLREDSN